MQQLEQANAFVAALDARRSWFRYHQLFADLLQLELRGSAAAELPALHAAAAGWYAEHGYPVEAVQHAQRAEDWGLAGRLLSDHWVGLGLNGLGATAHELLARFPAGVIAGDAELAARMAGDQLALGSLDEAERYLALATLECESLPLDRRGRAHHGCPPSNAEVRPLSCGLGAAEVSGHHGERPSSGSGDSRSGPSWRTSSGSRPSASISASTPYSADRSSRPVSTVSAPYHRGTIAGNADSIKAPRCPLIRIVYRAGAGSMRPWWGAGR